MQLLELQWWNYFKGLTIHHALREILHISHPLFSMIASPLAMLLTSNFPTPPNKSKLFMVLPTIVGPRDRRSSCIGSTATTHETKHCNDHHKSCNEPYTSEGIQRKSCYIDSRISGGDRAGLNSVVPCMLHRRRTIHSLNALGKTKSISSTTSPPRTKSTANPSSCRTLIGPSSPVTLGRLKNRQHDHLDQIFTFSSKSQIVIDYKSRNPQEY